MLDALLVEAHSGMASPTEVREQLEEQIEKMLPNPETWGTSERAVRGMAAAESLFAPAKPKEPLHVAGKEPVPSP